MLESNLVDGSQPFPAPPEKLVFGQSITDGCIGWETTERLVLEAAESTMVASPGKSGGESYKTPTARRSRKRTSAAS
jgi:hypothetical protein